MKRPNIAVTGLAGSGKSTVAAELIKTYGYTRFSWADPVKQIAAMAYGPVEKNGFYTIRQGGVEVPMRGRTILQLIGTDALRNNVDEDFWIKVGTRYIDGTKDRNNAGLLWVNDDTRFPNEVKALRKRGFAIIQITAPIDTRAIRRGISVQDAIVHERHASEALVKALDVDEYVNNDGTHPASETARIIMELVTERE